MADRLRDEVDEGGWGPIDGNKFIFEETNLLDSLRQDIFVAGDEFTKDKEENETPGVRINHHGRS